MPSSPTARRRSSTRTSARRPTPIATIARELLPLPTTSYREQRVVAYLRRFAEERGLEYGEDEFGNALITHRRGRARRPLVLGAHIDHPGFVVTSVKGRRLELEFRGGLSAEYGKGEMLRISSDQDVDADSEPAAEPSSARITSIQGAAARARMRRRITGAKAMLEPGATAAVGDLALWDVDECRIEGDIVHARQCDDLGGAVSVLATLDRLAAANASAHVIGLFTRAEEVGLEGAAAAARARTLPEEALVVAVETSSMAEGRAEQGGGPIIRVGDLQHVFSSRMTLWMTAVARQLSEEDRRFRYQRKLMDGGTTEATAYDLMGYETGAACVALGNYHNAGPDGRVAAETIHLGDLDGLTRLFERMATATQGYQRAQTDARKRWDGIGRQAAVRLRKAGG